MTRDEFKELINTELTVGGALPYNIPDKEMERIINQALNWAWINYQYSVTIQHYVIKLSVFKSQEFKRDRTITLPDCIVSIFNVQEIKGHTLTTFSNFGPDFSIEKIMAQEIYLSPYNTDSVVLAVAYESFWDLSKALYLDRIAFEFNHNSKQLTITGRDPKFDVWLQTYVKIPEEKLYDDWTFQRYCAANAKISLGRMLSMFEFNLPGGVSINADQIKSDGENELEKILDTIREENTPNWIFIYH